MIGIFTAICMILLLFFSGHLIECFKRIIMLISNCFLKLFNILGIHIINKENKVKVSKEFKDTFKGIKEVRKSKQNIKLKPSVNLFALTIFLFSVLGIVFDLDMISNGAITTWLYRDTFLNKIITSQQHMDTTYVAVMFSVMSFSISKLLIQWKETKPIRKTKRELKLKEKVFKISSSKELLDAAKMHDIEMYGKLKKEEDKDI